MTQCDKLSELFIVSLGIKDSKVNKFLNENCLLCSVLNRPSNFHSLNI